MIDEMGMVVAAKKLMWIRKHNTSFLDVAIEARMSGKVMRVLLGGDDEEILVTQEDFAHFMDALKVCWDMKCAPPKEIRFDFKQSVE